MPLSRYEIRNEYSLADPELYRAADRDDPEALLEGVAMSGLVGLLRQLGDLAEFAAEIFHDLHEDLIATAARGHGLTVRVQQIEAEFPSIEKAFLSHTSHSSFFYNTGVDWHPTVHMDQNLVTQGDLPRFVMDSYEECRGPPRLFLLDKFDVAGAGSCLKRYTDPSFFKTESPLSVMPSAEVQREKKGRKFKKKGSRWKNAETPEVLSTSHVKLQQLLLEERVENHVSDPARRVKLKRRLNGSPFDSTLGKSYMDAILKIPTHEPDIVREISITSSPLKIVTSVAVETENKVLDIAAISPGKDTKHRKRSTYSSSDSEAAYNPSNHSLTEEDSGISPNLTSTQIDHVHFTPNEVDKKEIAPERVRKIDGNQSDDEVDNYVDALTSMDSEMETDTEYRAKNDMRPLNVSGRRMGSDATEELSDIQTHSTDGQSFVNSSLTDGGNSISKRGKSSFTYSGSPDVAENAPSEEDSSAKIIQSTAHHEPSSCSSITESDTMVQPADPGEHITKRSLLGPELTEISSNRSNLKEVNVNNGESSFHLFKNIPWTSNYNSRPSRPDDADSSKMSPKSMDGENEQETHESYASMHLPRDLLLDSGNNSNEVSRNDIIQGELLENEQNLDSVVHPVQSPLTFFTKKEEFANSEIETCCPLMEPEANASEETASRCSSVLDCSVTADLVDMPLRKPENDHLLDAGLGFSHYQEIKPDGASSSKGDGEKLSGSSFDNDLVQKEDGCTYYTSEIRSCQDYQHDVDVSLDDGIKNIPYLQDKDATTAVSETSLDDSGGDAGSLDTRSMMLQAIHSLVLPDLQQNDLKSDEQHIRNSSLEEIVNKQANVFSELEPISSKTQACDDYSDLDLSHRVSDSYSGESSGNNSHLYEENAVECSYHKVEDTEAKSLHDVNVVEREEYGQSTPTRHFAGISTAQDLQVELYKGQFDVESSDDVVTELKSTNHAVVMVDTEKVLSSPKNHLAEVGILDQEAESQNSTVDVKSCHVTHDQVPESEYFHQTCAINVEEEISSATHHVTELRIPLEAKIEPQKDQFEFESRYAQTSPSTSPEHIDSVVNAEDLISSPTHIKAETRASRELEYEALTDTFSVEPCQRQHSDSCENAEASVAPFTYDTTELNPPMKHEVEFQNNRFEVKSWHHEGFESEQQIIPTESSETVGYSDTKIITKLTTPIDQTCELQDQFNQESRRPCNANVDPLSLFKQSESSIPNVQERESFPSEISDVHLQNQPSISQNLPQFSVSKPAEDPLISKFPTDGLLSEASLEEMPPLPPLPPMQWILGKAPHNFPAPEENLSEHSMHSVPPLITTTKYISILVHPTSGAESSYPSSFPLGIHNSQYMDADQADVVHSSYTSSRPDSDLLTIAPSDLEPQMDHSGKSEYVLSDSRGGILREEVNPFSPPTTVENTSSALPLSGKTFESLDQPTPSTSCKLDNKIQGEAIVSEEKTSSLPATASSLPVIHVYEKQPILSTSEQHATWTSSSSLSLSSSEDGTPNGNEKIKLPRPRNPLIDAVVAHDKSKLRKVTQLPQAQLGQKGEERDSLLEQIRAKSFNLKPAVVTRPSIQGPKTNVRLAAILEKANAIRQAFAGNGSDEDDDEDKWSDS